MFNKDIEKHLTTIECDLSAITRRLNSEVFNAALDHRNDISIITSQQETIKFLQDLLCEKYNKGIVIICDDKRGGVPLIIKNGEVMVDANNKLIDSVDINWNRECMMEVNCNYRV